MSGWCDYAGRRRYIEDHHSIVFSDHYKYFAVFDGHHGSRAAKFSSKNLHLFFETFIDADTAIKGTFSLANRSSNLDILASINGHEKWRQFEPMVVPLSSEVQVSTGVTVKSASEAMLGAFNLTNYNFIKNTDDSERSGTTATVAVLFLDYLLLRQENILECSTLSNNPSIVMSVTQERLSAVAPTDKPFS